MVLVTGDKKNTIEVEYDPFTGPEIERIVPCTEPQVEILTACLLGGNDASLAFNESITLQFSGPLDYAAMQHAFQKIINRHQSLRSVCGIKNKQLFIFKELIFQLPCRDISLIADIEKQPFIKEYIHQDSLHLFDLANGPLFKAGLIKLCNEAHCLVITAHHIICDGWSLGIILQDLSKLYSAQVQNIFIDLPPPVLFSRFAREQTTFLQSNTYQQIEKFWEDQYKDAIPVVDLPTDFTRPLVRTYKSGRLDYELDKNVVAGIKSMATKAGCSLVTSLLAAFETLLYRLTGQTDIVTGLPAAGQSVTGNYQLVGHCVNLLPLRSNPTPELSFLQYLEKRKTAIFDAYEHQQLTFGSLLKKLKIPRDPSRIPLVPVVFNIDMGMDDGVDFLGLQYQLASNPRSYENFELFLNVSGSEKGVTLEWSYNTQLFKAATINRMMGCFEQLLEKIIDNPGVHLGDIKLVKEADEQQLIYGFNNTEVAYTKDKTIVRLIEEQAAQQPASSAIIYQREQLTYQQLNERANRLAHYLRGKGVGVETIVPICIERNIDMVVGILGILKAGCAYVPIDADYPSERIRYILEDTNASLVITDKNTAARIPSINKTELIVLDEVGTGLINQPTDNLNMRIQPNHLAYVIYTSGSTGKPKGVMIEHASLLNYLSNSKATYIDDNNKGAGSFIHLSYSFDASLTALFMPLMRGRLIVIGSKKDMEVFEDDNLLKYAPYDFIKITPSHITFLKNKMKDANGNLLTNKLVIGGEALKQSHVDYLIQEGIDVEIINEYGPTEATVGCSTFCFNTISGNETAVKEIPIGKPMDNVQLFIVDKSDKLLPIGVSGEICIAGDGLARGYLNRPDLTAEKFISNPFNKKNGARLYKTGDSGRWLPDGTMEYLGRMDGQIKIRGYRIELGEIENALESIAGIKEAVVLCKINKLNDPRLVAYIVTGTDHGMYVSKERLNEWKRLLGLQLPVYMIPVHFEILSSLPLTINGKKDRNALPEPTYQTDKQPLIFDTPHTAKEKLVAGIWSQLLDIHGSIGLTDNFFELGGHSLIAIEVMTRIEKQTGKKLPPSILFQHSTIASLAMVLDDQAYVSKWKSLVPIKPSGTKDPLYIVHGAGLDVMVFNNIAKYMDIDQPVYGIKAKGKDGDAEILETIEEMAAFYISEIIEQNPSGPYLLAGFSAGSVVAFEMARQLLSMNKEIKLLGNIDFDLEDPSINKFFSKKTGLQFLPRLLHVLTSFIRYPKQAFKFQLMCLSLRYQGMLARLGVDKKTNLEGLYLHIENAMGKYASALKNHVMKPLEVEVHIFSTEIKVYYLRDSKFLGWKPFALKGIKKHMVPGDHDDMLLPPNDKQFARVFQQVLDKL